MPEPTKPDVTPAEDKPAVESAKKDEGYKIPERGHFEEGNLSKFADAMGLFAEEKEAAPPEKKGAVEPGSKSKDKVPEKVEVKKPAAPDDEDCPGCREKTPIDHVVRDGKRIPIYTEADRRKILGMKPLEKPPASDEKLDTTSLDRTANAIETLIKKLDPNAEEGATGDESGIDNDLVDPEVKKALEAMQKRIDALAGENDSLKANQREDELKGAAAQLDNLYEVVRKEEPFAQVVNETEGNVTNRLLSGLVVSHVNQDRLKNFKDETFQMKGMEEYMRLAAHDLATFEKAVRSEAGGGGGNGKVSMDSIKADHPDTYEEIRQAAVADYLNGREATSEPTPRSTSSDAPLEREPSKNKKRKSLRDMLNDAVDDPDISDGIDRAARGTPRRR